MSLLHANNNKYLMYQNNLKPDKKISCISDLKGQGQVVQN